MSQSVSVTQGTKQVSRARSVRWCLRVTCRFPCELPERHCSFFKTVSLSIRSNPLL
jgi:hypothetical protein